MTLDLCSVVAVVVIGSFLFGFANALFQRMFPHPEEPKEVDELVVGMRYLLPDERVAMVVELHVEENDDDPPDDVAFIVYDLYENDARPRGARDRRLGRRRRLQERDPRVEAGELHAARERQPARAPVDRGAAGAAHPEHPRRVPSAAHAAAHGERMNDDERDLLTEFRFVMNDARKTLRGKLGDRYDELLEPSREAIRALAKMHGRSTLVAALDLARESHRMGKATDVAVFLAAGADVVGLPEAAEA